MATEKARVLRELPTEDLTVKEKGIREELFNLRFQQATGQLENVMRVPQVKRDIAKVKTILHEKGQNKGK